MLTVFGVGLGVLGLAIASSEPSGHAAGSGAGLVGIEVLFRMAVGAAFVLIGAPMAILGIVRLLAPAPRPPPPWHPDVDDAAVPAGLPGARVVSSPAPAPGRGARGSAR